MSLKVAHASEAHSAMQEAYKQYQTLMSENAFNEPLHIKSSFNDDLASGEIYALINHDFPTVSSHLLEAGQWCDMLVLHVNVKGCYVMNSDASPDAVANKSGEKDKGITLFVGRNHYQPIEDAHAMHYEVSVIQYDADYMKATLSSETGPFGTSDYLLEFEVIPLTATTSFMHFKYSYNYGFMAKVALGGYLATLGRKKVGFTVDKYDENNKPVYVKGMQGIVERNSMRYFIAIKAFLDTYSETQETINRRIEHWYQLALPYKQQLAEIEDRNYLETKRQEFEKKVSLETAMAINASNSND
jgi:hypothetical protein